MHAFNSVTCIMRKAEGRNLLKSEGLGKHVAEQVVGQALCGVPGAWFSAFSQVPHSSALFIVTFTMG